jgi:proteasome assembly chaperone (PAC2) family protein
MEKRARPLITKKPNLRQPYLVCGISGWVDGGRCATGTVEYLQRRLKAIRFAEIPLDRFHVYQVPGELSLRPHIKIEDGLLKEHSFPQNLFFYWLNPGADRDLILFTGTEPNLHWQEYADSILEIVKEFDVSRIYLLGGVLDRNPHTREPNVSCACSSRELKEEMLKYGVQFTSYEGPGRFGTTLLHICQKNKVPMVSLTARATYYPEFNIVIPHNPKAIRAIVKRLNSLLSLNLDLSDLDADVAEYEGKLASVASRNPEFRSYLEKLEQDYVEIKYEEPLELSADEAVRIAEELLKKKKD